MSSEYKDELDYDDPKVLEALEQASREMKSHAEQRLWDEVARDLFRDLRRNASYTEDKAFAQEMLQRAATIAFDEAEAFIAERRKRLEMKKEQPDE